MLSKDLAPVLFFTENMLYLFNTNIIPSPAVVRVTTITREYAKKVISESDEIISAIGHEATAQCLSEILNINVKVNRINAQPTHLDRVVSLKLNGRVEEGKVLTMSDMEQMGYTLYLMEFYDQSYDIHKPELPFVL